MNVAGCLIRPLRHLVATLNPFRLPSRQHGPNRRRSGSPLSDDTTVVTDQPFCTSQNDGLRSTRVIDEPSMPSPRSHGAFDTNGLAKDLAEQLRRARIEGFGGNFHFYISRQTMHELINECTVTKVLAQHITDQRALQRIVRKILGRGKALFAILVLVGKEAEIELFFNEGIFDDQLPLQRHGQDNEFNLWTENGRPVVATKRWKSKHREKFFFSQWWFLATVFEDLMHYELSDHDSLPTVPLLPEESHLVMLSGGCSDVFFVRFHPKQIKWSEMVDLEVSIHSYNVILILSHVSRQSKGPLCAVKRLHQSNTAEFRREQQILLRLTPRRDPHLIKLLSTYRKDGKWHLIFPFADSDLRKYWNDRPIPDFDRDTVLWSLTQMTGIAGALDRIHKLTITVNVTNHDKVDSSSGTTQKKKQYETLYGRHGDIKPENFLWFERAIGVNNPKGVLQLADFGLGRLHGQHSSQGQTPVNNVPYSPTYEPPEYRIGKYVSQAYDMWSLGCVLLEFVTWLVLGSKEVYKFADYRGELSPRTGINDDNFYTITSDTTAIVRTKVLDWVNRLHRHNRSSQLIHDLLNLITEHLIVVEPRTRIKPKKLHQELNRMLNKAIKNDSYALTPMPRP